MPRFLLRLPKSQTRQLHVALIVSLRREDQTFMTALMPQSYQWPNASCSRNDESKLARMRSNLCCSHHVLGIRTKLRRQEQLSASAASHLWSIVPYTDANPPVRYVKKLQQRQSLYAIGQVQKVFTRWQCWQYREGRNRSRRGSNDVCFAHSQLWGSKMQSAQRLRLVALSSCMHINAGKNCCETHCTLFDAIQFTQK